MPQHSVAKKGPKIQAGEVTPLSHSSCGWWLWSQSASPGAEAPSFAPLASGPLSAEPCGSAGRWEVGGGPGLAKLPVRVGASAIFLAALLPPTPAPSIG